MKNASRRRVERDLVRIAYISTARAGLTGPDVEAIAAAARTNNERDGLTGLLICQNARFYGILEGPRRRVFACMERIVIDPRHGGVEIILETAIESRRFASWVLSSLPGEASAVGAALSGDAFMRNLTRRLR